jgi:hypothetical protein
MDVRSLEAADGRPLIVGAAFTGETPVAGKLQLHDRARRGALICCGCVAESMAKRACVGPKFAWQGQPPALRDPTMFLRFRAAAGSDSKLVELSAEVLNVFFPLRRLLVSREAG